jgi:hypothetical protein
MVDRVLLGSGESKKGQGLGAVYSCSWSADAPCLLWQEQRVMTSTEWSLNRG